MADKPLPYLAFGGAPYLQSPASSPGFRGIEMGFYSHPILPVRGKAFSLSTTADHHVIARCCAV